MRRRSERMIVAVALAAAVAGCSSSTTTSAKRVDADVERLFGRPAAIEIVAHPDKVLAIRLDVSPGELPLSLDAPGQSAPVEVAASTAAELSAALLSADTYSRFASGCVPDYGMRLQFARDDKLVDVFVCFECNTLTVAHNGKRVGGKDFDDGRHVLVRAAKTCFPDDAEIQGLKEDDYFKMASAR